MAILPDLSVSVNISNPKTGAVEIGFVIGPTKKEISEPASIIPATFSSELEAPPKPTVSVPSDFCKGLFSLIMSYLEPR